MSFSSCLLCWVLSTGWMRGSVGRPMTSESEHCCRGENLGDALLQQQEVGRRGRARGLRLGLVAIALGILPLPIIVAFFFLGWTPGCTSRPCLRGERRKQHIYILPSMRACCFSRRWEQNAPTDCRHNSQHIFCGPRPRPGCRKSMELFCPKLLPGSAQEHGGCEHNQAVANLTPASLKVERQREQ